MINGNKQNLPVYFAHIDQVDFRAKIFRECEAMASFALARGRTLERSVSDRLGLLDVGIEARFELPMSELVYLHQDLARVVEPASPRAIELMIWDSRARPFLNRLAPSALRGVLLSFFFVQYLFNNIFVFWLYRQKLSCAKLI